MKVLKFEDFINEAYLGKRYKEMTSITPLKSVNPANVISIIEPKSRSSQGWSELVLYNEDGKPLNANTRNKLATEEILGGFLFDNPELVEKVPSIISKSLNILTNNQTLEKFKPKGSKYYILDLGKAFLWNGKMRLYVEFVPSDPDRKRYRGGHFYAVGRGGPFGPELFSIFYSGDKGSMAPEYLAHQALYHLKKDKGEKIEEKDFMDNYEVVYPYGEDFELSIDFTAYTEDFILREVLRQVDKSQLPPKMMRRGDVEGETLPSRKPASQISIRPGKKIGLIVPFISKDKFTTVTIKEILNLKEIQDALKLRGSLGDIEELVVTWYLDDKSPKPVRSVLRRGTKIKWESKGEGTKEGKIVTEGSFITPDKNLILSGVVPIRVNV